MELLEDPSFKTKYQKHKLRVKLWESDFMEKYGRKPNKNDIKEADATIREAYKMYWKLKTHALEETLTDITFSDDIQANVFVNSSPKLVVDIIEDKKSFMENSKVDTENIDPHSVKQIQTSVVSKTSESELKNIEGMWGEHLSKSQEQIPKKKQNLLIRRSSFQLSQNKFTSTSFTKRNPRKSLSMSKIRNNCEKDDAMNTISSVDQAGVNNDKDERDADDKDKRFRFGETLKVVYENSKPIMQSVSTVQHLIKGDITIKRDLNEGWLNRCSKENNVEITQSDFQSHTSDSGIESIESIVYSPQSAQNIESLKLSDEEDFICNSDSEEERRNKRVRNFKKRLSDEGSHVSKRQCTEFDSNISETQSLSETLRKISVDSTSVVDTAYSVLKSNDLQISEKEINLLGMKSVDQSNDTVTSESMEHNINATLLLKSKNNEFNNQTNNLFGNQTQENNLILNEILNSNHENNIRCQRDVMQKMDSTNRYDDIEEDKKNCKKSNLAKPIRRKVSATNKEKEPCNLKTEKTKHIENESYGVESLQTLPRFAMPTNGTGNLIADFSKSLSSLNTDSQDMPVSVRTKEKVTKREKLEQKIAAGNVNDNYVRINLKKKVYVRGKRSFNFSKYKKNQWKQRKKELASSEGNLDIADLIEKRGVSTCFKCGDVGHFAKNCIYVKRDKLLPLEEIDETSSYPTLEEVEKMANQTAVIAHCSMIDKLPEIPSYLSDKYTNSIEKNDVDEFLKTADFSESIDEKIWSEHKVPEDIASRLLPPIVAGVKPLYETREDFSLIETPSEVFEALHKFGHDSFRTGQEKAVMRILSGQSTLVTLSTGSGKSLCYQLPAYLYSKYSNCITLVISPLVSLMDDQVTGVPSFLSAACLHTNQTPKVRENVMNMIKQGNMNILLVSPEAVMSGEKSTGFGALFRQLPPIAFACIDEAHCISQWSHNFRPSYLMICRVLKEKLGVKTILGLTATATKTTAESIVNHLCIHDGMTGVISDVPVPNNLFLTISKDENKDRALINLLQTDRFKECDSIIVYCTRREECSRIAGLLRSSMQDSRNSEKANAKISSIAEAYHAGLPAYRRKSVQKAFMNGQTRIVVATVAFGMGINKSDIRSVIHYNMPASFEAYVQEIGRAGRDGMPAHCHVFLSPVEESDKWELRRHIHANTVDRHTIRRLLQKIFVPCSCSKIAKHNGNRRCPGHEVAISIDETVRALDIPEETILTLLCYLELHSKKFITVLSSVYVMAKVSSYNGPQALKQAANSSPPLAMAIALDSQKGISHENSSFIEFPVVNIASAIGWDSGVIKSHLKNLEWKTVNGKVVRSAISVQYNTLGFRVKAPGDLDDAELDEALDALFTQVRSQETSRLQQVETINSTLTKFSKSSIKDCADLVEEIIHKSNTLKEIIRSYFESDSVLIDINPKLHDKLENEAQIVNDIRSLVLTYRDNNFNGRAVARIFHGIQSPNYPAPVWSRCRFWRAYLSTDFNTICQIATREILALH